jgi:hypothetical protein
MSLFNCSYRAGAASKCRFFNKIFSLKTGRKEVGAGATSSFLPGTGAEFKMTRLRYTAFISNIRCIGSGVVLKVEYAYNKFF